MAEKQVRKVDELVKSYDNLDKRGWVWGIDGQEKVTVRAWHAVKRSLQAEEAILGQIGTQETNGWKDPKRTRSLWTIFEGKGTGRKSYTNFAQ